MTDAEIIKALKCCIKGKCSECPLKSMFCSECVVMGFALALINRQKVENERLQKEIDDLEYHLDCECSASADVGSMLIGEEKAKAEAIKEFAQRLKYRLTEYPECYFSERVTSEDIDNLVKEITGELGF